MPPFAYRHKKPTASAKCALTMATGILGGMISPMSNVHRLRDSDRIFFITANLSENVPHLTEAEFADLLRIIQSTRRRLGFLLCGYVLMPDHWHALIFPRYPLTISRVLQDLKSVSARTINPGRHRKGALWQHQFWDRFVRHAQEFRDRLEYPHRNPVTAGLVERPEDWRCRAATTLLSTALSLPTVPSRSITSTCRIHTAFEIINLVAL